jgi:hypothetical protein
LYEEDATVVTLLAAFVVVVELFKLLEPLATHKEDDEENVVFPPSAPPAPMVAVYDPFRSSSPLYKTMAVEVLDVVPPPPTRSRSTSTSAVKVNKTAPPASAVITESTVCAMQDE